MNKIEISIEDSEQIRAFLRFCAKNHKDSLARKSAEVLEKELRELEEASKSN